ncbi:MAG: YceI family protein [Gammaproteobacteria bacterium]|nr:YceI family protein [Gammaproteobacteria bacterium]
MLNKVRLFGIVLSSSFLFSSTVFAGWTLDGNNSSLYYVTSKAAALSELNSFTRLAGEIRDDGSARVIIGLESVDTAIDIRNERMRDIVFHVENNERSNISINTDIAILNTLDAGESISATYDAVIELIGEEQTLPVNVVITGLENRGLLVTLARPLIVNVALFGLADEIEQLREIAGLPSINNNIVVDFTLQFDADN